MATFLSVLFAAASLASSIQSAPKAASLAESLKPFEGRWKGDFTMGQIKMEVDLAWIAFGKRWWEVQYTYTAPQMKLEARVLMSANTENTGFNVWTFGSDNSNPDSAKGVFEGNVLVVRHTRPNTPDIKFWVDENRNLQMRAIRPGDKPVEIGQGVLKPAL